MKRTGVWRPQKTQIGPDSVLILQKSLSLINGFMHSAENDLFGQLHRATISMHI